ncbi:MAG: hypothetical protein RSB71_03685 [Bacilli bacterium]
MDIFNVVWKKYDDDKKYVVGHLIYDKNWFFKYNNLREPLNKGFRPFVEMPNPHITYFSKTLFKTFSSRLAHKNREYMKKTDSQLITDHILVLYKK